MIHCRALFIATLSLLVFLGGSLAHAIDPRFELDPRMMQQKLPPATPPVSPAKESVPPRGGSGETSYTVKRGDSLVKILRRDFGKSNSEARALIPEIERRNRLSNSGRLEAGRHIIIPLPVKSVKQVARTVRYAKRSAPKTAEKKIVGHRLVLFKGS
ncbi:MAG TPA: LysM peptidoglycan-binding domain-containing protein, partial [Geobacteraceae bacterium]|nr:LysM peptidoglycan-binding domain-containing protein [Geobacteraceae bacterium]